MKRFFINWIPLIVCCVVIFYLSSIPVDSPVEIKNMDKAVHLIFYAVLAFLAARASGVSRRERKYGVSLLLIITVSLYGGLIELYQSYLPTRTASVADGIANFAGAMVGVVIYVAYHRLKRERI